MTDNFNLHEVLNHTIYGYRTPHLYIYRGLRFLKNHSRGDQDILVGVIHIIQVYNSYREQGWVEYRSERRKVLHLMLYTSASLCHIYFSFNQRQLLFVIKFQSVDVQCHLPKKARFLFCSLLNMKNQLSFMRFFCFYSIFYWGDIV